MNNVSNRVNVSVIMPVYNVDEFLSEAINSVLAQSITDIELILVNDGSSDKSVEICKRYLEKDKRVKYLEQKNSGVSVARNNGLSSAIGEYIFFMDSDDTIDLDFLKTSYEVAKKENSDIVVIGEYYCKRMPNLSALPTCGQMLNHQFLKKHTNIRFPESIQPCEDGLFSHRLLALTDKVAANPKGQYIYRQHERQNHVVINKNSSKILSQIPLWFEILENFYTQYNLYNKKALHLALFMEHEPFELRYMNMPFNHKERVHLHKIIVEFMNKNVLPYISSSEFNSLSPLFKFFVRSKKNNFFDIYLLYRAARKKVLLLGIQFIPITKLRRKMETQIRNKY